MAEARIRRTNASVRNVTDGDHIWKATTLQRHYSHRPNNPQRARQRTDGATAAKPKEMSGGSGEHLQQIPTMY